MVEIMPVVVINYGRQQGECKFVFVEQNPLSSDAV